MMICFFVIYHSKLNTSEFWTFGQTKQDIWRQGFLLFHLKKKSLWQSCKDTSPIPLKAGCHAQGPPTVEGLTALHHYQVDQVPWQRLVVGRQQQRVQAEEHIVLNHSNITIHAGHTHLEIVDHSEEGNEISHSIYNQTRMCYYSTGLDRHEWAFKH